MAVILTADQQKLVSRTVELLENSAPCAGERGRIVRQFAAAMGVSLNTAYTYLRKFGGLVSGRKPRKNKGKTEITEEVCQKVSGMMLFAQRNNGKRTMTAKLATEILQANGEEIVGSTQTVRRAMRLYGVHPDQIANGGPTGGTRSLYPNHVWQIDASVCVLYYPPKGGLQLLDERKFNAKKPENLEKVKAQRVIRYVVIDHYSGAFFLQYHQAGGENATGILQTLISFMADRGHHDPCHGIPEILYTDNGSGNLSSLVKGFCVQLGIRTINHLPNRANATGSVEQAQNLVETQFEGRLRIMDVISVDDLQARADSWRRHYLSTARHGRTGKTRNGLWLRIPEDKLKTVSRDVLEAIAHWKGERRPVGNDFVISVNTRTSHGTCRYDLRELAYHGLNVKDSVKVRLNPFSAPEITAIMQLPDGTEKSFAVRPMRFDEAGQNMAAPVFGESFKSLPKTESEKKLEKVKAAAYGVKTLAEAEQLKKRGKKAFANIDAMADVKEAPLYLGRTGSVLNVKKAEVEAMPMNRIEFAMFMKREHPEIWNDETSGECMAWLASRYPATVPGSAIDNVIEQMAARFTRRKATVHAFEPEEGERWAG